MKFEAQSLVAIVAIVASFLTTWVTLRTQRRGAHTDRIWNRKVETYELFIGYCTRKMKERHEYARGQRTGPFEIDMPDVDEDFPLLDRMLIYSSEPVGAAVELFGEADVEWRQAYGRFLYACEGSDDQETQDAQEAVRKAGEKADALAHLVMTVIRRELTTGFPARRRWIKRLQYRPSEQPESKPAVEE